MQNLKEKYTKSLLKTVSAFSNFHDGYIYVGINDQGEVVGLPKIHDEKMVIGNSINTTITPKPFFDMNILEFDGKEILEIKVYNCIKIINVTQISNMGFQHNVGILLY